MATDKDYVCEGKYGQLSLSDRIEGRSQLIIYYFIYGADWKEGCLSCFLSRKF